MATAIPTGLTLNAVEQEAFHEMRGRERQRFNALPNNGAKLAYLQALVDRKKIDSEKSVCLFYIHIFDFLTADPKI